MKTQLLQRLMIAGLATTLTTGAWAQQDSQQKQSDGDSKKPAAEQQARGDAQADSKKSKKQRDQRDQSDQRSQKDRQQQRQQAQRQRNDWDVEPAGWIRVASDTDNDGFFDTVETIYVYDLEQARKNSRMRANRDAQRLTRSSRADRSQQRASDSQRTATVRGTIENLHKDTIAGLDGKFIFSRIKTQNGRVARVLLGPDSHMKRLDVQEGDEITVQGVRGRINDRPILLARKVDDGQGQVSIDMPSSRNTKRVKATIKNTRKANFRRRGEYLVANVELPSGKQSVVNLGPTKKLGDLDLQKGDEVALIVRPARINGQPAMVAEQIRHDDQTIKLSVPNERSRRDARMARRDRRSERMQDRGPRGRGARTTERTDDSLDPERRAALGVTLEQRDDGITIAQIHPGTPAANVDLQEGDRIVAINDKSVDTVQQISNAIRNEGPDNQVKIKVNRDGKTRSVKVRLANLADIQANR